VIKKKESKVSGALLALHLLLLRHLRNSIFAITTGWCDRTAVGANISFLSTTVECPFDDDTAEAV
jgi:Flp pilus assembly protein protease CpaA